MDREGVAVSVLELEAWDPEAPKEELRCLRLLRHKRRVGSSLERFRRGRHHFRIHNFERDRRWEELEERRRFRRYVRIGKKFGYSVVAIALICNEIPLPPGALQKAQFTVVL